MIFKNKKNKNSYAQKADLEPIMLMQGKIMAELNKSKKSMDIQDYEFKVTSQNGEDGIIQYLIQKYNIKNKSFIEFGVESYNEANTRFLLQSNNWSGLVIDGNEESMRNLKASTLGWKYDLTAVSSFITRENINKIIKEAGFSGNIGILSVDIDGNDYWVLEAIDCVEADILILEYNSLFGPNAKISTIYDPAFVRGQKHYSNLFYGASISALCELANKKGYSLLGSNNFGNNLFFISNKYESKNKISPKDAYVKSKFRESRDENGAMTHLSHKAGLELLKDELVFDFSTNKNIKLCDVVI